ncbi:MAG TPA: tetratricopeptide repeat-containing glycosyltransferase family protein [Pseudolabrys sp.]|nr:tetratricopeptide repeat-containing glycosyltransferase family protein [Pseudolabrys sp.]
MSRPTAAVDLHGVLRSAIASHQAGRLAEAEPLYRAVLDAAPQQFDALHLLGVLHHQRGRSAEAAELIGAALRERPDDAVALTNRSAALNALSRFDEAIAHCDRALAARPDHAEAHNNRALALRELGRVQEALAGCERALRLKPGYADAYNNRGLVLQALRRAEAALGSYDTALQLDPQHLDAINNRGIALFEQNRLAEALACFDRALAVRPSHAHAHWNRAQVLLLTGDFVRGWAEHEWRTASNPRLQRRFDRPLWRGDAPVAGKTVLLHAEQGLGDTLQFCRYAPMVAARGARVVLEVQRPLIDLVRTLGRSMEVVARGDALPDFDFHCPLLSLPLAFGTDLASIPAGTPYLRAPASATDWEARLGAKRPRIGLVWSGNPGHKRDRDRSIPLYALLPLLDLDATFVSLQKDVRAADAAVLKQTPVIDVADALTKFSETAAIVSALDLVISVDTSVAHLSGALGKPTWLLLPQAPDWRWLTDRADSPWYPAARLFRQDGARAWGPVVARVRAALEETIARGA